MHRGFECKGHRWIDLAAGVLMALPGMSCTTEEFVISSGDGHQDEACMPCDEVKDPDACEMSLVCDPAACVDAPCSAEDCPVVCATCPDLCTFEDADEDEAASSTERENTSTDVSN